jgi:hypothetical protein
VAALDGLPEQAAGRVAVAALVLPYSGLASAVSPASALAPVES